MQMRTNVALLTDVGISPTRNPSMDTDAARVASLVSLEDILKQAEVHWCSASTPNLGCYREIRTSSSFMETSAVFLIQDI